MARKDIVVKGSTIKLKAIGGGNTEVEIECVPDDYQWSWGKYDIQENKCHKSGVNYDRSTVAKFGSFDISINGLPNDKNDAVRTFLRQALDLEAGSDFDVTTATGDKEFTITQSFLDPNTNTISIQGFITEIKTDVIIDNALTMIFTFQQTKKPVFT